MLQDIINKANKWGNGGKTGRIDPFTEVYNVGRFFHGIHVWGLTLSLLYPFQLVFVMTARMATCHDLAENEADLEKVTELFMTLQTNVTPTSLMFPWFPSPARRAVKQANTEMYTLLSGYIENRRRAKPTGDAIDVLIADGVANENIVWVSPPGQKVLWGFVKFDHDDSSSSWGCFSQISPIPGSSVSLSA